MSGVELALLVLLAAAAAAAAFVGAELAARAWLRARGEYYVWPPYRRLVMEIDRGSLPSLEAAVRCEFNSLGERGPEPPADLEGVYRVLVAGGSAAECYLLDQASAWPLVLGELLNRPEALGRLGARAVHVGSVARSLVTCQAIHHLLAKVLARDRELDLAVLMVGASDVVAWLETGTPAEVEGQLPPVDELFAEHPEGPFGWRLKRLALWGLAARLNRRWRRPIERRSNVGRQIARNRELRRNAAELLDRVPDPAPMLASFERWLRRLIELFQERGTRVLVVRQPWFDKDFTPAEEAVMWNFCIGRPHRDPVTTYYTHRVVRDLMRQADAVASRVAGETGAEQLDLMPLLERSLATYYDFLHFTPQGARAVAEAAAEAVAGQAPVGASSEGGSASSGASS